MAKMESNVEWGAVLMPGPGILWLFIIFCLKLHSMSLGKIKFRHSLLCVYAHVYLCMHVCVGSLAIVTHNLGGSYKFSESHKNTLTISILSFLKTKTTF